MSEGLRPKETSERILDTASALLIRFGYNKVTMEDIAKEANVSRATVYARWKNKESLFQTLMARERLQWAEDMQQRMSKQQSESLLHDVLKYSTLTLFERPLSMALVMGDSQIIGKFALRNREQPQQTGKLSGFAVYLSFLREQGLVRTDQSLAEQIYIISALLAGFTMAQPMVPGEIRDALSYERIAELAAEAARRTLEVGVTPANEVQQQATSHFLDYMNKALTAAREALEETL